MIDAAMLSGHHLALNTTAMAFGASAAQGTGCLIALMISAAFIYRLMTQKLPHDMQRPGVVSVAICLISYMSNIFSSSQSGHSDSQLRA